MTQLTMLDYSDQTLTDSQPIFDSYMNMIAFYNTLTYFEGKLLKWTFAFGDFDKACSYLQLDEKFKSAMYESIKEKFWGIFDDPAVKNNVVYFESRSTH